jgi:hypothetical protein
MDMFDRIMSVALLLGLAGFVASATAGDAVRLAGELTKIDGKALTITADGKGTVVTCDDATKIGRGGGQATFADLRVGQSVRAYHSKSGNVAAAVFVAKP